MPDRTRLTYVFISTLLIASSPSAQIAGVSIVSTATQAVIRYRVSDARACAIHAGEQGGSALVNDINPNLFPGADSDARFTGWRADSTRRVFVLGTRRADRSGDARYSRTLAADTVHWFRIMCGAGVYSGTFRTKPVAAGQMFPEPPPFEPTSFGNYGWPTIDWADKSNRYIDPMTGVRIQLLSTPGAYGGRGLDKPFGAYTVLAGAANWRDVMNVTSATVGTLAEYSGPGGEPIFVAVDPTVFNCPYCQATGISGFDPTVVIDDVAAHVYGHATAAGVDAEIQACLTLDSGRTCVGRTLIVRLPRGASEVDVGDVPATFPQPEFAGWGRPIRKREMPAAGMASISGGVLTVTSEANRSYLMETYGAGALIQVTGAGPRCAPNDLCSLASVDSAVKATLNERFDLDGQHPFKAANVGLKIWKTTGNGTIRFRVRMDYAYSLQPSTTVSGSDDRCGRNTVTVSHAADGVTPIAPKQAYLCGFPYSAGTGGQALYLVPLDGEPARLISLFRPQRTGNPAGDRPVNGAHPGSGGAWDRRDPTILYELYRSQSGKYSLYKIQYDAIGCKYKTLNYGYRAAEGGDFPESVEPDCMQWMNLTPPSQQKDIDTQAQALFPEYDAGRWGTFGQAVTAGGVSGTHFIAGRTLGGQDTACYVIAIDLATGIIGRGWRMWDGDEGSRRRFATCHSIFTAGFDDVAGVSYKQAYAQGSRYGGKWEFQVVAIKSRTGWNRPDTSLGSPIDDGSYDSTCPGLIPQRYKDRGATGNNCITLRINHMIPCRVSMFSDERASHPCPWDASRATLFDQPMIRGDQFADSANLLGERFQIVQITAGPPIEIVAYRHTQRAADACGAIPPQRVHRAAWTAHMVLKNDACEASDLLISVRDGTEYEEAPSLARYHHDYGSPLTATAGEATLLSAGPAYRIRTGGAAAIGRTFDYTILQSPSFAEAPTLISTALQSYPSKRAWSAAPGERAWALDFRHINGSFGSAPEIPDYSIGGGAISVVRQTGTTKVYRIGPAQNDAGAAHNPKLTPALVWAGFHHLQDKSSASTGDVLTDADDWRYCFAYRPGECRAGSRTGDFFAVVPGLISSGTAQGNCHTNQYSKNVLCYASGSPLGGWIVQLDVSGPDQTGGRIRKLTMGFSGPGRQYVYNNVRALPDGKRAMFAADWAGGDRREYFLLDLPTGPHDSVDRTKFIPIAVHVPPGQARRVVATFGYAENGPPENFLGTTRQEVTIAVTSAINAKQPFRFAHELTATDGVVCIDGCTIVIPAISGRILFYQLHANNGGSLAPLSATRDVTAVY